MGSTLLLQTVLLLLIMHGITQSQTLDCNHVTSQDLLMAIQLSHLFVDKNTDFNIQQLVCILPDVTHDCEGQLDVATRFIVEQVWMRMRD